jgi:hypothetical protein
MKKVNFKQTLNGKTFYTRLFLLLHKTYCNYYKRQLTYEEFEPLAKTFFLMLAHLVKENDYYTLLYKFKLTWEEIEYLEKFV